MTCALAFAAACASLAPEVGPLQPREVADASAPSPSAVVPSGDGASAAPVAEAGAGIPPATHTVLVAPSGATTFAPEALTVRAGDTVRWVWEESEHTVTSGPGGVADDRFCSPRDNGCATAPTSNRGAVYEHVFTSAGVYPYFCRPHREMMRGTVTVAP